MNFYKPGFNARSFFIILLLTCFASITNGQSLYSFSIHGHFTAPPPADTVYLYIGDKEYNAPVKNRTDFVINGQVPRTLTGYLSLQKGLRDQLFFVDTGAMVASFAGRLHKIESNQQTIPVLNVERYERSVSQAFIDSVKKWTAAWSYPYQPYMFNEKVYNTLEGLARKYRDNDAMVYLLSGYTGFLTSMQIKKLRSLLSKETQKSPHNFFVEECFVQSLELETFEPVHPDQLHLIQKLKLSKAALDSRPPGYVLVDFWATWCKPCLEEIEMIKPAITGNAPIQMINISFDDDSTAWKKSVNSRHIPGLHFLETKGFKSLIAHDLNIKSIPYNVLIDPTGKVLARGVRGPILANILRSIKEQGAASAQATKR